MIKRERFLIYLLFLLVILWLIYEYKQIVNSRGIVFKQQCENFSIQVFSEEGRNIMVQEFNPTYGIYGQGEDEIIKTANETVNQLGKVITIRLKNGSVCSNVEKKVILKNFTREEVIKKMVEFVAENQENLGYNFTAGNEPEEVCKNVIINYNTGL